jgi:hypothetical protein
MVAIEEFVLRHLEQGDALRQRELDACFVAGIVRNDRDLTEGGTLHRRGGPRDTRGADGASAHRAGVMKIDAGPPRRGPAGRRRAPHQSDRREYSHIGYSLRVTLMNDDY